MYSKFGKIEMKILKLYWLVTEQYKCVREKKRNYKIYGLMLFLSFFLSTQLQLQKSFSTDGPGPPSDLNFILTRNYLYNLFFINIKNSQKIIYNCLYNKLLMIDKKVMSMMNLVKN